jgi:hypothetical protein
VFTHSSILSLGVWSASGGTGSAALLSASVAFSGPDRSAAANEGPANVLAAMLVLLVRCDPLGKCLQQQGTFCGFNSFTVLLASACSNRAPSVTEERIRVERTAASYSGVQH